MGAHDRQYDPLPKQTILSSWCWEYVIDCTIRLKGRSIVDSQFSAMAPHVLNVVQWRCRCSLLSNGVACAQCCAIASHVINVVQWRCARSMLCNGVVCAQCCAMASHALNLVQ
jgi:hypothetical protein